MMALLVVVLIFVSVRLNGGRLGCLLGATDGSARRCFEKTGAVAVVLHDKENTP